MKSHIHHGLILMMSSLWMPYNGMYFIFQDEEKNRNIVFTSQKYSSILMLKWTKGGN